MEYDYISPDSEEILNLIVTASNPSQVLCDLFNASDSSKADKLRSIIGELQAQNYIKVFWADGIPYHVTVNNKASEYKNKASIKDQNHSSTHITIDKSINIGNGNYFTDSPVGNDNRVQNHLHGAGKKEKFWNRHPIITSVIATIIASFIMLFSFWANIIGWIEGVL